jgi:hypothetical protein
LRVPWDEEKEMGDERSCGHKQANLTLKVFTASLKLLTRGWLNLAAHEQLIHTRGQLNEPSKLGLAIRKEQPPNELQHGFSLYWCD